MTSPSLDGAQAEVFHEMLRKTLDRYIDDLTDDERLELMGTLILRRRRAYKDAQQSQP